MTGQGYMGRALGAGQDSGTWGAVYDAWARGTTGTFWDNVNQLNNAWVMLERCALASFGAGSTIHNELLNEMESFFQQQEKWKNQVFHSTTWPFDADADTLEFYQRQYERVVGQFKAKLPPNAFCADAPSHISIVDANELAVGIAEIKDQVLPAPTGRNWFWIGVGSVALVGGLGYAGYRYSRRRR